MPRTSRTSVLTAALILTVSSLVASSLAGQASQGFQIIASKGTAVAVAGPGSVPGWDHRPLGSSKLPLSWMMIVDSSLGVVPDGLAGGRPDIKGGHPALKLEVKCRGLRHVVAIEFSLVTFNIWNRFTGAFRTGRVFDLKPRQARGLKLFWFGMDREDLQLYQTSILYISRVRLADGTVIVADRSLVLEMAKRVESNFTEQDLDKTKVDDKDAAESKA